MGVTSPSQRGAFIAKLGAWMQAVPLLGIAAMMFGMAEIIAALGTSDAASYTARVSEVRGYMRNYTAIAVSMALIGLVLLTVAITAYRYRSKWMFKFLRFYGVLTIALSLVLVFGQFKINLYLPFGVFFLIFAQVKKKEFLRAFSVKRKLPTI